MSDSHVHYAQQGTTQLIQEPQTRPRERVAPQDLHWRGPGRVEGLRTHYQAFVKAGQAYQLGNHVHLQPLEPNVAPYIASIEDLYEDETGQRLGCFKWFYRPDEVELEMPLAINQNEVFASDEVATHPLDTVMTDACIVCTPKEIAQRATKDTPSNMYVCHRKYIPSEGRVVQLESVESIPEDQKRSILDHGQVHSRTPYPPTAVVTTTVPTTQQQQQQPTTSKSRQATPSATTEERDTKQQQRSRRKRKESEYHVPPSIPSTATAKRRQHGAAGATLLPYPLGYNDSIPQQQQPMPTFSPQFQQHDQGGRPLSLNIVTSKTAPPPSSPKSTKSKSKTSAEEEGAGGLTPRSRAHGRWAKERYEAAQRSLVQILKLLGASSPDKAVLRPLLREEARKVVGDTGLLDHLLKHLADQVVSTEGEKLRRRHNREGHMEYWLQTPEAAEREEAMLADEMQALSSELREVKEVRHVLKAVRDEAAQAIMAVSDIKDHPESVRARLAGTPPPPAAVTPEVAGRAAALEMNTVELARRLHDAESLAAAGLEAANTTTVTAIQRTEATLSSLVASQRELDRRCSQLEVQYALLAEDMAGKFEALAAAIQQQPHGAGLASTHTLTPKPSPPIHQEGGPQPLTPGSQDGKVNPIVSGMGGTVMEQQSVPRGGGMGGGSISSSQQQQVQQYYQMLARTLLAYAAPSSTAPPASITQQPFIQQQQQQQQQVPVLLPAEGLTSYLVRDQFPQQQFPETGSKGDGGQVELGSSQQQQRQ